MAGPVSPAAGGMVAAAPELLPTTGGNPLPPCYRQLSAAIFQLCAFKELIGGEIILSRRSHWRHNFIRLPRGLCGLTGGSRSPGSDLAPPPAQAAHGETQPWQALCQAGGPTSSTGQVSPLLHTSPGGALAMPLPEVPLLPFFPGIPAASALHKAWGWQPCPAQHRVPNPSPPVPTHSQSCGERAAGGDGDGGWPSPCPVSPRDGLALQLKGIIQIIPAWRHGSVAVMNSSEARRGRAHTSLITVADASSLPQPSPHAETPGSTRIPADITSP